MATPIDPDQLLNAALAGDRVALGQLLDHFRSQLRDSIRANLHGPLQRRIDESDVIQQACVQAVEKFEQFGGTTIQEFWSWLEQIQQNALIDQVRHHGAQKRDAHQEQSNPYHGDVAGRVTSASQKAMRGERQLRLQAVINELPEGQREAVQLRYLEGLKVGEIAQRMNRSDEAVAGLLKRGISAIKDRIGHESM